MGEGPPPVAERRLRHDIGIDCCPIKRVGYQLPETLRQESHVPNRFGFPVRRMKDVIEVGKCWISESKPKREHVMACNREKSQQRSQTKHDHAAKGPAPHGRKKGDGA